MENTIFEELGKILDKIRVKTIFYEETSTDGGAYHIIYYDEKDNTQEHTILGHDLDIPSQHLKNPEEVEN